MANCQFAVEKFLRLVRDFQERYQVCKFYRTSIPLVRRRNKCCAITCFRFDYVTVLLLCYDIYFTFILLSCHMDLTLTVEHALTRSQHRL